MTVIDADDERLQPQKVSDYDRKTLKRRNWGNIGMGCLPVQPAQPTNHSMNTV